MHSFTFLINKNNFISSYLKNKKTKTKQTPKTSIKRDLWKY